MRITHEAMVELIVETLQAEDGAGSDLVTGEHVGPWLDVRGNIDVSHLASDVLAATAPRQITTVEELDALPVGSVVLHNGRAFQHYPAYPAPFDEYQKWKCGDGGFVRSTKDGSAILPATVLHEPLP